MATQYIRIPTESWKAPVANSAALPLTGNTAGDARVTLDTSNIWVWNGSAWVDEASGGGSPGGSNTQVQFNDSGAFGGDADLTWNKTTNVLNITGVLDINGVNGISLPGTGNTFIGESAGSGNSGSNNTSIGKQALDASASGNLNTAIGVGALGGVTSGTGNTGIGGNAGSNITTEVSNVCIGQGSNITTGASNAMAMGSNAIAAVNNAIIFGDMNVNVGIANVNSSTPTARLHLPAGTATAGSAPLKLIAGTNLTSPEAGAIEFDGTNLYYTNSVPTRLQIATGSSGANTALSNLASVQINSPLIFAAGAGGASTNKSLWSNAKTTYFGGSNCIFIGANSTSTRTAVIGGEDAIPDATVPTPFVLFQSGAAPSSSNSSDVGSGGVQLQSGDVPMGAAASGDVGIRSGFNQDNNSGEILISTGDAPSGTRGQTTISGRNILLTPDTATDAGSKKIVSLADPTSTTDATNKQYVDGTNTNARAHASTTTISGTLATIVYATEDYDTGNRYNNATGVYTCSIAGDYHVTAGLLIGATVSLNNTLIMEIHKNGSVYSRRTIYLPAALTDGTVAITDIVRCAASDTLEIKVSTSSASPSIVSSNFDNYIAIAKV